MNPYQRKVPKECLEPHDYFEMPGKGFVDRLMNKFSVRPWFVQKYSWAIPTDRAIQRIAAFSPLIEIGAGTGYWAWLLQRAGAEVVPYDSMPPDREPNHWHRNSKPWTRIFRGGPEMVSRHPWHNLFLCWPPYSDPMAEQALKRFLGRFIIYVGEDDGCTATEKFHDELELAFEEIETIEIPQWFGIHDRVMIWQRKNSRRVPLRERAFIQGATAGEILSPRV